MTDILTGLAIGLLGATSALQVASVGAALWATERPLQKSVITGTPGVTVLRPVCGLENNIEDTLRTTFRSSYRGPLQIIFCCSDANDPVVPLVNRLIEAHPEVNATLLIGDDRLSGNPKLNNLVKGWAAAEHDYILMADSNVLLPHDYIQRLFSRWTEGTGLVTSPPSGIRATNLWGDLEAAFLNTYQGRWQLSSDVFGNGYAQGKMLFWRRDILDNAGGLIALGRDMAEDVASTKVVREAGLKVRLLGNLLPQPIGSRDWKSVWTRQVRWAKVRRMGFPALYAAEVLSGIVVPMLLTLFLTLNGALNWASLLALPILWFGLEYLLARRAGWPAKPRDIATWIMRDAMVPALWVAGWRGKGFEWRGNSMSSDAVGTTTES